MNQQRTPLFEALIRHNQQNPVSFHVPGHKNGMVFTTKGKGDFQPLLKMDVTELSGLDDLHSPEGVIQEAEALLTFAYNTRKSFFLINGSTVGNLSMILASFKEGDLVYVQRNCHKSVLNGLKLAKLKPIFIEPEFDENWKVATGITLDALKDAFQKFPGGKGIILTYPNYYGFVSDIKSIIDFCHKEEMTVLVDEAHGAHFIAGQPFPPSALQLGADIVVQSAHKTLPAMTMTAYLHINSDRVQLDILRSYLQVLQSSSPSYPLMASLDLARSYIATYDSRDKEYLIQQRRILIEELKNIPHIKVLQHTEEGDPLKIALQSTNGLSGFELQSNLERVGIYTELADPFNVLLVLPLLKNDAEYPLLQFIQRLKTMEYIGTGNPFGKVQDIKKLKQKITSLSIDYKEQSIIPQEVIPIIDSIGRNSAEMIIPYPPGIPLLMEGEKITAEKIEELLQLVKLGARFHGGDHLPDKKIRIFI